MLRKIFYVRRDFFYVRRDIFYVAAVVPSRVIVCLASHLLLPPRFPIALLHEPAQRIWEKELTGRRGNFLSRRGNFFPRIPFVVASFEMGI